MKKIKKVNLLFLIIVALLGYQSNAQTKKVDKILKDSEQRISIMKTISNDSLMMTEMIGYITENDKAIERLHANPQFLKKLMKNRKMNHMNKDSMMTKMMVHDSVQKKEGKMMCPMCKKNKTNNEKQN